jgi:hypothetical protein
MTGAVTVSLANVQPEQVRWLWPGWLPGGKLIVLDGDPGVGKSTLTVDLASRYSAGSAWPDGVACERAGNSLILSAEDGLADTIRPRVDAAGGDPSRIHVLTAATYTDEDGEERRRAFTLDDVAALRVAIMRHCAGLVLVDVFMAYLPTGTDSHRDQDVRSVLARLAELAEEMSCCIILLRHLNKSAGGNPLYRGGGSIGIVGAARAAYVAAPDPADPDGGRVLACTKNNLAPMPPSLGYRLATAPNGVARVEWTGRHAATAATLLARPGDGEDHGTADSDDWLRDLLASGPVKALEVYRAADAAGYSKDQARRAKKRLGVSARKDGLEGPWLWSLPDPEGGTKVVKAAGPNVLPPSPRSVPPSGVCPHGFTNGDQPDPFVNGRLACPICASEAEDQ